MDDRSEARPAPKSDPSAQQAGVISVAVIDDNRLVREGITSLLGSVPDLNVVGGGSGVDLGFLRPLSPQVILLDLGLGDGDTRRMIEELKALLPESKIIVMDLFPDEEEILELVQHGVSGFIMKDTSLDTFRDTIRSVASGDPVLPTEMTDTLFSQIVNSSVKGGREVPLDWVQMTKREEEVIGLISEGLSNKKIAARLHISVHTVKSHVRNIMEKLDLNTRLQIAAYAHRREDQAE